MYAHIYSCRIILYNLNRTIDRYGNYDHISAPETLGTNDALVMYNIQSQISTRVLVESKMSFLK